MKIRDYLPDFLVVILGMIIICLMIWGTVFFTIPKEDRPDLVQAVKCDLSDHYCHDEVKFNNSANLHGHNNL